MDNNSLNHAEIGEAFVNACLSDSSEYLKHHGIKGMKWGVRRYQNKDGSLTNAGKARYNEPIVDRTSTPINGVHRGSPMSATDADNGKCNPNKPDKWYDRDEYEAQMAEKGGYVYNCQSCAVAYEARVRGYDIVAGSRSNNPTADMLQDDISKAFVDPNTGKPPVTKKFNCDMSESDIERYKEVWWSSWEDPADEQSYRDLCSKNNQYTTNVDKELHDMIKPGERYMVKTRTLDCDDDDGSTEYRDHYKVIDWTDTKSKNPLCIETQSKWESPKEIKNIQGHKSYDKTRWYTGRLVYDNDNYNSLVLNIEVTRVDNCDLKYDVVEKVTERSKR